jgi:hypothetical protein
LNEGARIFHRRLLQDAVAQIQYMSDATSALDGLASRPPHALFRAKQ